MYKNYKAYNLLSKAPFPNSENRMKIRSVSLKLAQKTHTQRGGRVKFEEKDFKPIYLTLISCKYL